MKPNGFERLDRLNLLLLVCLISFAFFIVRADIQKGQLPVWFHLLALIVVAVQSPRKQP